jgi:hypothetical protein
LNLPQIGPWIGEKGDSQLACRAAIWERLCAMSNYEGYCVKCREKREFEGNEVELANGRRAAQGQCPQCGTKMNRMLGKS